MELYNVCTTITSSRIADQPLLSTTGLDVYPSEIEGGGREPNWRTPDNFFRTLTTFSDLEPINTFPINRANISIQPRHENVYIAPAPPPPHPKIQNFIQMSHDEYIHISEERLWLFIYKMKALFLPGTSCRTKTSPALADYGPELTIHALPGEVNVVESLSNTFSDVVNFHSHVYATCSDRVFSVSRPSHTLRCARSCIFHSASSSCPHLHGIARYRMCTVTTWC